MAYIDHRTGNQRVAAIGVVAVLQGVAIIALINGLTVIWHKPAVVPNPEATDIPITMPIDIPPPPPKPQPDRRLPVDPALPRVPLPGDPSLRDPPPIPFVPDPLPTQAYEPPAPPPSPTPTFVPRVSRPSNAPSGWATTSDYPARDLREGNQGVTRFTLTIGTDGRVRGCAVTRSSGYPGLDKAACDNVSRRARFAPATDGDGNRVAGSYSSAVVWTIPQD